MNLRGLLNQTFTAEVLHVDPALYKILSGVDPVVDQILSLVAAAAPIPAGLGSPGSITANVIGALHQDDDAHDTCSLTACLNPLHPGPCKGWKGTLFDAAPGAFHALEKAKADQANAKRVAKIHDLKAKGLPIPKKLLVEIKPKAHPHEGKTAKSAAGEAHEAGKAVSESSGVKVNEPGKVTLGQAVKTVGPVQLGPKGKKPTLASKGIAAVIGQEKVTPQYKLDKAAGITPEQWAGLSDADKASIRDELTKIKKDGFGPQQKKADELLLKLHSGNKPGTAPAEKKDAVAEAMAKNAAFHKEQAAAAKTATPKLGDSVSSKKATTDQHGIVTKPVPGGSVATTTVGLPKGYALSKDGMGYTLKHNGKIIRTSASQEALEKYAADHHNAVGQILAKHKAAGTPEVNAKFEVSKLTPEKVAELNKASAPSAPAAPEVPLATAKPKPLPAHVQHAIDMTEGKAPGASWSKNHLAAYGKLTPEEFHALPKASQDTIVSELTKAQSKFLDPKKVQAAKDLLAKFGKGPATPTVPKAEVPKAADKPVGFSTHLHDHSVTQAQAKETVGKTAMPAHFLAAKQTAGLLSEENPDSTHHKSDAHALVEQFIDSQTAPYDDGKILGQPAVNDAVQDAAQALFALKYAQSVHTAKSKSFNKISKTLGADDGKLSPIEKASLQHYQKHLLDHPVKTDTATMDQLQANAAKAIDELHVQLQAADKKAKAPNPDAMSPAQIADAAKKLMGQDADQTNFKLSNEELDAAIAAGDQVVDQSAGHFPGPVLADPKVAAKLDDLKKAAWNLENVKAQHEKYGKHLTGFHTKALSSGTAADGTPLTADDNKIIAKHAAQIADASGLDDKLDAKKAELKAAEEAFNDAANAAVASLPPPEPLKLSDFDKATVDDAYANAWAKHASKATVYGLKTYQQQQEMKAHADYPGLTTKLGQLKFLAGKVALAHAEETLANNAIPLDPDTGSELHNSPEYQTWLGKMQARLAVEEQFAALHKDTQKDLDTVRTAVGLKKRALPKLDNAAVKAAAAETGHYKTGAYSGPNYGKPAKSKSYMLAKVGPKLGVKHESAAEKKAAKLGTPDATSSKTTAAKAEALKVLAQPGKSVNAKATELTPAQFNALDKADQDKLIESLKDVETDAGPAKSAEATALIEKFSKIKNPSPAGTPVPLSGGTGAGVFDPIPDAVKKQITSDFKGMPSGKYLADPAEDIFNNLVTLAAVHGKGLPNGLSVDQVLKTIDETHSKNLGVANSGMLHQKITDWLGTTAGKEYAQKNSTPNAKKVKQLTGEVDLPAGVVLKPGEKVQPLAGPGPFDSNVKAAVFHPFTASQAESEQSAFMTAQGIKWTGGQKKAMTAYTGNGPAAYDGINNWLRGKPGFSPVVKQYAVDIQAAMMPLRKPTLLKRGTGWPPEIAAYASHPQDLVGEEFEDKGFVSTTVAGSSGHFSGKPLQLTIEAPAGTPAVFVNGISHYKGSENEMLLAAGLSFRVLSVEVKNGQTHMRVRVVGEK